MSVYYQSIPVTIKTTFPEPIAGDSYTDPQYSFIDRINWDHTFHPNLINTMSYGYLNRNEAYGAVNAKYVNEFPKITGVAGYSGPPVIWMDDVNSYGNSFGESRKNLWTRPTHIGNDLLTWVKGRHTIKLGGEFRSLGGNIHSGANQMGTFWFNRANTGLLGTVSGNSIASFLLEAVSWANADFRTVSSWYPRQHAYIVHAGDTWRISSTLSLNYGLRWDLFTPFVEKYDHTSFLDLKGANPSAGGRPGRLVFAGNQYGAASYGNRHPEEMYWKGFAPRLGIAYSLNNRTVIRTGYGIFFDQALYPFWDDFSKAGGISLAGFNASPIFGSEQGGMKPAFWLHDGFPQNFAHPPFIDSGFLNGPDILYRPTEGNQRPYSQQWNLTLERLFKKDVFVSAAYVGSKGTRVSSFLSPLNALDPKYLSMGYKLWDQFEPAETSKHGVPLPYEGWVEQLQGCSMGGATVAQALLPYPQYCSNLFGRPEFAGNSTFHSFQAKIEKRFSGGMYLLGSYTLSKLLTSGAEWSQSYGWWWYMPPFEPWRNKFLSMSDVPHTFSLAYIQDLPFGKGKRFLNQNRVLDKILGGWSLSTIIKASSGIPFYFRNWSNCVLPAQFAASCVPAILPGENPWAQDKKHIDPYKPLFRKEAFEPESSFSFYLGKGPRISNLRGFGYHNQDLALVKNTQITERLRLQIRAEAFNLWNWHIFAGTPFFIDTAHPNFGIWNGGVTDPRNIQIGLRLEF